MPKGIIDLATGRQERAQTLMAMVSGQLCFCEYTLFNKIVRAIRACLHESATQYIFCC